MSSYSDAYADANGLSGRSSSSNFDEHRLKTICFGQLNPKPYDAYLDRSEKTIFFFCLILIIAYWKLISLSYPMINEIYSKDEYFRRELQIEQDDIRHQKKEFAELFDDSERQGDPNDLSCRRCFSLISQIDIREIFRILDNQEYVKHEYDQSLLPLQSILIVLCLLNNLSIQFIFEQALKLFLLSNLFLLLCFGIYAEFFIEDQPSVFYTLIIAVFIHLFTISLLLHVLKTFVIIRHYQRMKKTCTNLE